jgi:hypothetical protein
MAGTVRADRDLYRSALADAIDWTESLIDAGDNDPANRKLLARYRQAYAALGQRVPPAERESRPVPIQDLPPNDHIRFPGQAPRPEKPVMGQDVRVIDEASSRTASASASAAGRRPTCSRITSASAPTASTRRRSAMAADDRVSAELTAMERRAFYARPGAALSPESASEALTASAADVPRLLAAVEIALEHIRSGDDSAQDGIARIERALTGEDGTDGE